MSTSMRIVISFLVVVAMVVFGSIAAVYADPVAEKTTEKKVAETAEKTVDKAEKKDHDHEHDKADANLDAGAGGHGHIGEKGVSENVIPSKVRLDMVIYNLAVFLVLMAILTNYAWGPITKALDERESQITGNIEAAEQKLASAQALLEEHRKKLDAVQDEVRAILAEARKDAEHTKNDIVATANKEAQLLKDRAVEDVARARDQALSELFGTVSNQVAKAAEQVIRRSLTSEDHSRFVNEAVSQFVSRN